MLHLYQPWPTAAKTIMIHKINPAPVTCCFFCNMGWLQDVEYSASITNRFFATWGRLLLIQDSSQMFVSVAHIIREEGGCFFQLLSPFTITIRHFTYLLLPINPRQGNMLYMLYVVFLFNKPKACKNIQIYFFCLKEFYYILFIYFKIFTFF